MSLVRLSSSTEAVLSMAEIRAHLRLQGIDEDGAGGTDPLLAGYARAAQSSVESWLGRALTTQQWKLTLDAFPQCEIEIPLPPCQSVDALTYIDSDGATQSITDYRVYGIGGATPARLAHAHGSRWPATRRAGDAVSVVFTAGYGSFTDVPEAIRAALMLMTTDLFEHRGSIIAGDGFQRLQPTDAAMRLLLPYRVW